MEDILGNTGLALQFLNSLLEDFEIGLQLPLLYSGPSLTFWRRNYFF